MTQVAVVRIVFVTGKEVYSALTEPFKTIFPAFSQHFGQTISLDQPVNVALINCIECRAFLTLELEFHIPKENYDIMVLLLIEALALGECLRKDFLKGLDALWGFTAGAKMAVDER